MSLRKMAIARHSQPFWTKQQTLFNVQVRCLQWRNGGCSYFRNSGIYGVVFERARGAPTSPISTLSQLPLNIIIHAQSVSVIQRGSLPSFLGNTLTNRNSLNLGTGVSAALIKLLQNNTMKMFKKSYSDIEIFYILSVLERQFISAIALRFIKSVSPISVSQTHPTNIKSGV